MIAAGSLFTSCVENTEPQGIKDLREAKADYLASLSKLREADAEKVKAEAAVEQAKAEVQKAIAAQNQALAEAQQIANEAASIANEEAAARAKAAIDTIRARAELDAVKAQEALAKAQADLDKALRKIAAESIGLNGDEKQAIWEKTFALNMAYGTYNAWLDAYNGAVEKLWRAEYDVVAGVKGYETADSYRDSIADQNELIATANETIASLEALKEHPQAVKDTLDAIDAQIAALTEQWTLIVDEKILYEATPGFVAAKKEFEDRVAKFQDDSLKGADFKFVDVNKSGKDVPVKYELTDGLGVDRKFGWLINDPWFDATHKSYKSDDDILSGERTYTSFLPMLGFYYDYSKTIEVGFKHSIVRAGDDWYWSEPKNPVDTVAIGEGLDVLDKIVETLNRELVVIDNLKDSITVEDAKKAAHVADSIFDAHYAILKAGLKEYAPYKDSVEIQDSLKLDTAAAHKAYAAALNAYNTVKEDSTKKDNARILAVRAANDAYKKAKTALDAAKTKYNEAAAPKKTADSTAYIAAFNAFGAAQAAFCGKQDSLTCKQFDPETGDPKPYKEALSEITLAKFKKGSYISGDESAGFEVLTNLPNVDSPLDTVDNVKDSIAAVKYIAAVAEAIKAFDDFNKTAVAKAKHDADSTANDVTKAETALTNYKGVTEATIAYQKIYKSFWGITRNLTKDEKKECVKPQEFTWTKKTFLEPTNCVEFTYYFTTWGYNEELSLIKNSTLETVLKSVDPNGFFYLIPRKDPFTGQELEDEYATWHTFFGDIESGNLTEFARALFAAQIVEDLGEYVPNKARLEKINAQVAKIRKDVEAAIAEYKVATEGLDEVKARFYGVDEDGKTLPKPAKIALVEGNVKDGKWAFGGYLLEWAEELAPEYPAIVKAVNDKAPELLAEIGILANYRNTLDLIYTGYFDVFKDPEHAGWNVDGIIKSLNEAIKYQKETVIAGCEAEIAKFEESIDACEAGYSPAEAKVAPLKKTVEAYKKLLEQAEEALKRAQAEYDAVIALYGVNE